MNRFSARSTYLNRSRAPMVRVSSAFCTRAFCGCGRSREAKIARATRSKANSNSSSSSFWGLWARFCGSPYLNASSALCSGAMAFRCAYRALRTTPAEISARTRFSITIRSGAIFCSASVSGKRGAGAGKKNRDAAVSTTTQATGVCFFCRAIYHVCS